MQKEGLYHRVRVPFSRRVLPALGSIFKGAYYPSMLEVSADRDHPEGRFPTITKRLAKYMIPHGLAEASPNARQRCEEFDRCWPAWWFEDSCLLWDDEAYTMISADHIELIMGFPR